MSFSRLAIVSKKWFTISNIITGLMLVLLVAMVVNPGVKAVAIRSLMKLGLFQPNVSQTPATSTIKSTIDNSDLVLINSDGHQVNVQSLRGKVVFLNFWATWCPPCLAEMPSIDQLYNRLMNDPDIVFLLVDMDADMVRSKVFLDKNGYDLPLVIPGAAIPARLYGGTLPTTVILDKNGSIVWKHEGVADYSSSKFVRFLQDIKQAPSPDAVQE